MDQKKPKIDNVKFIKANFLNSTKIDRLINKNQIIIIFAAVSNINFANKNTVKTIVLSKEKLSLRRRQMSFLKDRDSFSLH